MMKVIMTIIATVIVIMEIAMTEFKMITMRIRLILPLYKRETLPLKLRVLKVRAAISLKSLFLVHKITS